MWRSQHLKMQESFFNAASNQRIVSQFLLMFLKPFFKSFFAFPPPPYWHLAHIWAAVTSEVLAREICLATIDLFTLYREAAGLDDYLLFGGLLADCLMTDLNPICAIHLVWLVDWHVFVLICWPEDCAEGVNAVLMVWLISWLYHW